MSRRPHKKSKNGCFQCKRRHMRCDENRPICANCSAAEIRCSFLGRDSPQIVPVFAQIAGSSPVSTSASTPPSTLAPPLWHEDALEKREAPDPYSVDMMHLELFSNLSSEEFLSFEASGQPDVVPSAIYIKNAHSTPYLMHELLAMSAFHLSTKKPESRDLYRQYATGLQNRALSLFNESNPALEATPVNCVNMFLFSSALGVHLLCDTFQYQRGSLAAFIDRFTRCLSIYRGVVAILAESRHLLCESELAPHLALSRSGARLTETSGSECTLLLDLVGGAEGLTVSARKACREAVLHLQRTFDSHRPDAAGDRPRTPGLFAWPVLVSPEYVELLDQRQAVALIILAYFAVLLHQRRAFWLIGEGGRFLIESICEDLGAYWHEWLKFPKAALQEDLAT